MLYESVIVDRVCDYLSSQHWKIASSCGPTQKGDDIVATRGHEELPVEAKGEGSEQPTSSRFGQPFTCNQVRSHVAVAFYRAAKMRADSIQARMAFPDNEQHREMVAAIEKAIRDLRPVVHWIDRKGNVIPSG